MGKARKRPDNAVSETGQVSMSGNALADYRYNQSSRGDVEALVSSREQIHEHSI